MAQAPTPRGPRKTSDGRAGGGTTAAFVPRDRAAAADQAAGPACAIVFTTDETYLFPTLVSAIQARRHASRDKADVLICHFGISAATEAAFATVCAAEGLHLIAVDPRTIDGAGSVTARLHLNRFIPARYTQYLYLDGDVQIAHSLDPLIDTHVPPGRFLAANDPMTFMFGDRDAQTRALADHLRALGLSPDRPDGYFNTGVMRISRAGWDEIGARAWRVARDPSLPFLWPDQDSLNMVALDRRMLMSLSWNFPIFMRNARVQAAIAPCITHFMSAPKPWQGAFAPWGRAAARHYLDARQKYPALAPYHPALPLRKRARYQLQQVYKMAVETCGWGLSERRTRILRYEERARLVEQNHAPR
jgi:lipopolysaccharide biosynthesis glycosyltransferase